MESALGHEWPLSVGGLAAASAVIVCAVLVTWLPARLLTGRFSRR